MRIKDSYFVDMRINHGNSGGPVLSIDDGCVIGVVDAMQSAYSEVLIPDQSPQNAIGLCSKERDANGNITYGFAPAVYNVGIGILVPAEYVTALLQKNKVAIAP